MTYVIDVCLYHNDAEVLTWRMEELWDVVDKFVVIQGDKTFSGIPKQKFLDLNAFAKYQEKLHAYTVTLPVSGDPWEREYTQRRLAWEFIHDEDNSSLVLLSDADEIPSAEAVERVVLSNPWDELFVFEQRFYYYYANLRASLPWYGTRAIKLGALKHRFNGDMQLLRNAAGSVLADAGWHFSYIGGVERVQEKLHAFSHQELNRPDINNEDHIYRCMNEQKDLFGRSITWAIDNEGLPWYIPSPHRKV